MNREGFDAYAKSADFDTTMDGFGDYRSPVTHAAWTTWLYLSNKASKTNDAQSTLPGALSLSGDFFKVK